MGLRSSLGEKTQSLRAHETGSGICDWEISQSPPGPLTWDATSELSWTEPFYAFSCSHWRQLPLGTGMTLGETPVARGTVSQGDSAESCQQATPLVLWRVAVVGTAQHPPHLYCPRWSRVCISTIPFLHCFLLPQSFRLGDGPFACTECRVPGTVVGIPHIFLCNPQNSRKLRFVE